ncbi:uncharacterized protein [Sinocyclocheilus grahami]|uniref:uncharacterized protein n=1 Tax=Sinocyclocheilus grahami TaxID=75366 RepID=UPI0007AC8F44|nr:PREDICTED: uncharacterized protein LOC107562991 [Sinocyclocheilus grahami]
MERAIVIVIALVSGILFCEQRRVFGAEVDMRVKAGDSITLYSDCVIPLGSHIFWWRNCSHEHQPSLFIEAENLFQRTFPRFSFVPNSSSNSYDLHITNISVSDEGLYYCAIKERNVHGIVGSEYQYGNRRTRLSLLEPASPHAEQFNTSSTPSVSDLCWSPLFSVCPVCVLLFSVCVFCLCRRKTTVAAATQTENRYYQSGDELCYASLNTLSMLKKNTLQNSDFCTYTEVRTKRT